MLDLDHHDFAKFLMSKDRKFLEDTDRIIEQISLEKGITVADLGCGPGYYSLAFSKAVGDGGIIYAVDRSEAMIQNLRENLKDAGQEKMAEVRAINADVIATGIPSAVVDLTLFASLLHDIEDKNSFFEEIKRISKADARFVDIDWHKRETEHGPPVNIRLSENESRKILQENGFLIVHSLNVGPSHYGFVCKLKK